MAYRHAFGSKARALLWARCTFAAYQAGRGRLPICPHCDLPVQPTDRWDRCHVGAPAANDGKDERVGHRRCNQRDNAENVTPSIAKAERVRRRFIGAAGPGLGKHPMPGGVRSRLSRSFRHGVVERLTLSQRLERLKQKRGLLTEQAEAGAEAQP